MFYVYVLKSSKDKNIYIGSTNDIGKRLREHNDGRVISTKSRRPFVLLYYEAYGAEEDARRREHNLKPRKRAWAQLRSRLEKTLENE